MHRLPCITLLLASLVSYHLFSQNPVQFVQEHPGTTVAGVAGTIGAVYGSYRLYKILSWHWLQSKSPYVLLGNAQDVYQYAEEEYGDELKLLAPCTNEFSEDSEKLFKQVTSLIYQKFQDRSYPILCWYYEVESSCEKLAWQIEVLSYKQQKSHAKFDDYCTHEYPACIQALVELHNRLTILKKLIYQSAAYRFELLEKKINDFSNKEDWHYTLLSLQRI